MITRFALLLGVVGLAGGEWLLAGEPAPQTQPARSADTTAGEAKRLDEETAAKFGMTVEQCKQMVAKTLGEVLLYDRKTKLVVSWQANPDKSAHIIHIAPDPLGREKASVRYQLGDDKMAGRVTYMGALPRTADDRRAVIWQDLNADGIFDLLMIPVDHNELLNLDRGGYILLDGKWTAAVNDKGKPDHGMKVGNLSYRFDAATGRWVLVK